LSIIYWILIVATDPLNPINKLTFGYLFYVFDVI